MDADKVIHHRVVHRKRRPKGAKQPERPPREPPSTEEAMDMAGRANTLLELRLIWKHTGEMGLRDERLETVIKERAAYLKSIGTQR